MKTCFVACPIGSEKSKIRKRSNQLFNHVIKVVCEEKDLQVIRSDLISETGSITDSILKNLREADLVIVDCSDLNPNVFYELGYRAANGKPYILLAIEKTNLPFDISAIRTIFYNLSDLDDVDTTKKRLSEMIGSINFEDTASLLEPSERNRNTDDDHVTMLSVLWEIQDAVRNINRKINNDDLSYSVHNSKHLLAIKKFEELLKKIDNNEFEFLTGEAAFKELM